jgi:hypothetical protein
VGGGRHDIDVGLREREGGRRDIDVGAGKAEGGRHDINGGFQMLGRGLLDIEGDLLEVEATSHEVGGRSSAIGRPKGPGIAKTIRCCVPSQRQDCVTLGERVTPNGSGLGSPPRRLVKRVLIPVT